MSERGQSWQRVFAADAYQTHRARAWVQTLTAHEDAAQITGELFVAILAVRPSKIQATLSTAGTRTRITAASDRPLPLHSLHGPGRAIIVGLAVACGASPDGCGMWAELPREPA